MYYYFQNSDFRQKSIFLKKISLNYLSFQYNLYIFAFFDFHIFHCLGVTRKGSYSMGSSETLRCLWSHNQANRRCFFPQQQKPNLTLAVRASGRCRLLRERRRLICFAHIYIYIYIENIQN